MGFIRGSRGEKSKILQLAWLLQISAQNSGRDHARFHHVEDHPAELDSKPTEQSVVRRPAKLDLRFDRIRVLQDSLDAEALNELVLAEKS
jgi:hypothetical protein